MPQLVCQRCHQPLAPILPGQDEHPLCSPTDTGWIPRRAARQIELPITAAAAALSLALELAGLGWHVFPLSPATKRPLGNCRACQNKPTGTSHAIGTCPCLPAGRWCHGVRAATTNPVRLATWWCQEPRAVPGIAAGPSRLVLIDIDTHTDQLPGDVATGLLPGVDLAAENIPQATWRDPARYRDGRDSLQLLATIRGGLHPWPTDPGHQPVTVATPSGGRHLWYRAPAPGLRQALADPAGRYGLAWQVDIKAGWSYGLAPGTATTAGTYQVLSGDPARPGHMPAWLACEVTRVAAGQPTPRPPSRVGSPPTPGRTGAAYLTTIINRGAARLAAMADGRKRALAALAYQAGGLLTWSGLTEAEVTTRLTDAGTASGLGSADAHRIVTRSLVRGLSEPLPPPPASGSHDRAA